MGFEPPGYCPNCGEYVEEGALACESCGSCPSTGWNEEADYGGLDLPEDEEGVPSGRAPGGPSVWGYVAGAALVVLLAYVFIFR